MNYLFICLMLLTLTAVPVFAEEYSSEQTTTSLENTTTPESLTNETKDTAATNQNTKPRMTKPKNKWDFSDHKEDKAKKNSSDQNKSTRNKNNKRKKFTNPEKKWADTDTETTHKSLTTNNTRTIKYPKQK